MAAFGWAFRNDFWRARKPELQRGPHQGHLGTGPDAATSKCDRSSSGAVSSARAPLGPLVSLLPVHRHADGAGHACHLSPGSAAGLGPRAPSLNPGCRAEAGNSPRCPRKPESLSRAFNAHSVSTHACLTQVPAPLTGPGPRPSPDTSPRQTPQLPPADTGPRELPRPRHGCRLP